MRSIIAAALILFSVITQAKSWETENVSGGKIILTDRECNGYQNLREAYAISATGEVLEACWALIDNKIHVAYRIGEKRVYDPAIFTKVEMY